MPLIVRDAFVHVDPRFDGGFVAFWAEDNPDGLGWMQELFHARLSRRQWAFPRLVCRGIVTP